MGLLSLFKCKQTNEYDWKHRKYVKWELSHFRTKHLFSISNYLCTMIWLLKHIISKSILSLLKCKHTDEYDWKHRKYGEWELSHFETKYLFSIYRFSEYTIQLIIHNDMALKADNL